MTKIITANEAKARRKPHNARTDYYDSFEELLALAASAPSVARIGDREVTMPRSERLLRVMLARAREGKVRDITKLLQIMAKSPAMATLFRGEIQMFIRGVMARV
jgi:hypothetical protein